MGAGHAMKRIPRIKFPQRHGKPSGNSLHTFPFLFFLRYSLSNSYSFRFYNYKALTQFCDHLPAISHLTPFKFRIRENFLFLIWLNSILSKMRDFFLFAGFAKLPLLCHLRFAITFGGSSIPLHFFFF